MELESLIRRYVTLERRSSKGFEACICQMCNDYKPRGGFKFDGNAIGYHCFNCNYDTKFDADEYKTPSKKFKDLLRSFGIDESDITLAVGKAFVEHKQQAVNSQAPEQVKWAPPKAIDPPLNIHLVNEDTSPWCETARTYLKQRALEQCDYPFMVSEEPRLLNRLIIPYFHRDKLIYYQARSMNDVEVQPRYVNPIGCDKDKLIFNYDELFVNESAKPLYITEGPLDALSIGPACALLGSTISEWKLNEIKKAEGRGRKIVFVIDKNENGYNLGLQVLKEGWQVTVLPDGVDDANHGLQRFGKLWLLNYLTSSSVADVAAQVMLRMKCK